MLHTPKLPSQCLTEDVVNIHLVTARVHLRRSNDGLIRSAGGAVGEIDGCAVAGFMVFVIIVTRASLEFPRMRVKLIIVTVNTAGWGGGGGGEEGGS